MRKIIFMIISFCCMNFSFWVVADQQPGPKMVLDEILYDFQEVSDGNTLEHVFKIYNKGQKLLVIEKVQTG